MPVSKIEDAIEDIRAGKMVIIVDDEDRENEGDLAMSAEKILPRPSTSWQLTGEGSFVSLCSALDWNSSAFP
jgi:3,4-dihydroxy 2-butanone 4-phosphate synthase/GTP cyclohydrolase II